MWRSFPSVASLQSGWCSSSLQCCPVTVLLSLPLPHPLPPLSLPFPFLSLFSFPPHPGTLLSIIINLHILIYSVHFNQLQWLLFDSYIFLSLVNGRPRKLFSVTFDMTLLRMSRNLFLHFFPKLWNQLSLSGALPPFRGEWLLKHQAPMGGLCYY